MSRYGLVTLQYGRKNDAANAFTSALHHEAVDKSDTALERAFRCIDVDGSGRLSEVELDAHIEKTYGKRMPNCARTQTSSGPAITCCSHARAHMWVQASTPTPWGR